MFAIIAANPLILVDKSVNLTVPLYSFDNTAITGLVKLAAFAHGTKGDSFPSLR